MLFYLWETETRSKNDFMNDLVLYQYSEAKASVIYDNCYHIKSRKPHKWQNSHPLANYYQDKAMYTYPKTVLHLLSGFGCFHSIRYQSLFLMLFKKSFFWYYLSVSFLLYWHQYHNGYLDHHHHIVIIIIYDIYNYCIYFHYHHSHIFLISFSIEWDLG